MNALQKKYGVDYAQQNHPHKPHCHLQYVGLPCNQFGYQEPAENHELLNGLKYVRPGYGFEPNFPVAGKLEVNGAGESPLFTFLKARCPAPFGMIANRTDITWTPIRNNDISWNFQKWIIDHNGDPIKRYTSRTDPAQTEDDIVAMIDKCVKDDTDANATSNSTKPIEISALKPGTPADATAATAAGPGSAVAPAPAPAAAGAQPTGPSAMKDGDELQHEAEAAAAKTAVDAAVAAGKPAAAAAQPAAAIAKAAADAKTAGDLAAAASKTATAADAASAAPGTPVAAGAAAAADQATAAGAAATGTASGGAAQSAASAPAASAPAANTATGGAAATGAAAAPASAPVAPAPVAPAPVASAPAAPAAPALKKHRKKRSLFSFLF